MIVPGLAVANALRITAAISPDFDGAANKRHGNVAKATAMRLATRQAMTLALTLAGIMKRAKERRRIGFYWEANREKIEGKIEKKERREKCAKITLRNKLRHKIGKYFMPCQTFY
jgi:hypothetical protein